MPDSDHNMHLDNPIAMSNMIINDLIEGAREPILTQKKYSDMENGIKTKQSNFKDDTKGVDKSLEHKIERIIWTKQH